MQNKQSIVDIIFDTTNEKQEELNHKIIQDLIATDEIRNLSYFDLAFHLHQLSTRYLSPKGEMLDHDRRQYINQLGQLKLEEIFLLFKTIAYCNFNSSLAVDHLIWLIGETRPLHESFFDIKKTNVETNQYEVLSISENQFVREELKIKLKRTPYHPCSYNCRYLVINKKYLHECIKVGNLRLIKWINQVHFHINPTSYAINLACQNGHLEIFEYLYERFSLKLTAGQADLACLHDHLAIVQYINESCGIRPTQDGVNKACKNANVELIQYINDKCGIRPDSDGADRACMHGHLKIIIYLYKTFSIKPTSLGADWACVNGHLKVIIYLKETFNVKPSFDGAVYACGSGNLKLIQYIHQTFNILPTSFDGIDLACQNGHLKIIQYIYQTFNVKPTSDGADCACSSGHFKLVYYLNKALNVQPNSRAADLACQSGNLKLLKYIGETFNLKPTFYAVDSACLLGHNEIVQFVNETFNIRSSLRGLEWAHTCGHLEIVTYILWGKYIRAFKVLVITLFIVNLFEMWNVFRFILLTVSTLSGILCVIIKLMIVFIKGRQIFNLIISKNNV
jgi:hypothetical protein